MHTPRTLRALARTGTALSIASLAQAGSVEFSQGASYQSFAPADQQITRSFNLFNHPGGDVDPQAYGLRLDGLGGGGTPITFSFENDRGESQVRLDVVNTGSGQEIRIHGVVWGNSADGGQDYGSFMLDVTYRVDDMGNGWEDNSATGGTMIGGLTAMDTTDASPFAGGEFQQLFSMSDGEDCIRFLADGFRVLNDAQSWVGRGWVSPDGGMGAGNNDFLFVAQIVPLPAPALAGLAMLAGLGVTRRVRASRR